MSQTFQVNLPDGATLEGHLDGDGPPIVLISGLGGTGRFWQPVLPFLDGFTTITFDQRAIGNSTRGDALVTIGQLAADVRCLMDHLGLAKPVLVGHSTGGCIAMECAISANDNIGGLALSGTWCGPDPYMRNLFAMRMRALHTDFSLYETIGTYLAYPAQWLVQHPIVPFGTPAATQNSPRINDIQERIEALLAFDRRDDLACLYRFPALVFGAEDDMVVPVHLQKEISNALPQSELHLFATGGHFFPLSRTAEFSAHLLEWIEGI